MNKSMLLEVSPSNAEQGENLIIQFAIKAYEDNSVTFGCVIHNLGKPFVDVGLIAYFDFVNVTFRVIIVHMRCQSVNAHLSYLRDSVFLEVSLHKCGDKIFAAISSVHDHNGYSIDWWHECADDVHDDTPVFLTESERGLGYPNERVVRNDQKIPINWDALKGRRIIPHSGNNCK